MQGAKVEYMTFVDKVFYLSIGWLDALTQGQVMIVDADSKTGRLSLFGEPTLVKDFHTLCFEMIRGVTNPEEEWRNY